MNLFMKEKNIKGATNYRAWKARIDLVLARHKVLGIVIGKFIELVDQTRKEKFQEDVILERRIIIEFVKDHLISYIVDHQSSKAMCGAIIGLYTINSININGQLHNIKIPKNDIVASYFVKISQIRDEFKTIEEEVPDKALVVVELGYLPRLWDYFASSICGRENARNFDKI